MTTQFTKLITSALVKLSKNCKNIVEVNKEENIWLGVPKGKQNNATYFIPDVLYVTKKGVLIFQICDSQAKSPKQIAGDYFTALLSQEVIKIYFVTPVNKQEEIKKTIQVYHSILKHKFKLQDHRLINFEVIGIKKGTETEVMNQLLPFAQKDLWGYKE